MLLTVTLHVQLNFYLINIIILPKTIPKATFCTRFKFFYLFNYGSNEVLKETKEMNFVRQNVLNC